MRKYIVDFDWGKSTAHVRMPGTDTERTLDKLQKSFVMDQIKNQVTINDEVIQTESVELGGDYINLIINNDSNFWTLSKIDGSFIRAVVNLNESNGEILKYMVTKLDNENTLIKLIGQWMWISYNSSYKEVVNDE